MLFKLLILFICVPLVELYLLVEIGMRTQNAAIPILIIVTTGVIGAWLVKSQGRKAVRRIKDEVEIGNIPKDALLDGLFIFAGGIVLVTPGVLTDLAGISLLVPYTRAIYRRKVKAWIKRKLASGEWKTTVTFRAGPPGL